MLRLPGAGKGGWIGRKTKIRIKWQLENWSYSTKNSSESSVTDAKPLMVILHSIR